MSARRAKPAAERTGITDPARARLTRCIALAGVLAGFALLLYALTLVRLLG